MADTDSMADTEATEKIVLQMWCLYFMLAAFGYLILHCVVIRILRHGRPRLPEDSIFVVSQWPKPIRRVLPFVIVMLIVAPTSTFFVAHVCALVLAPIEGWSYNDTFEYILCNMVGIGPLVEHTPDSVVGQLGDILVSIFVLTIMSLILGLLAASGIATEAGETVPQNVPGLIVAIVVVLFLLMLMVMVCSCFLSLIEGVDLWDCFLYMSGVLCGIEDPLTDYAPTTNSGNFFAALCSTIELGVGGAIIGVVGTHKKMWQLVEIMEGQQDERGPHMMIRRPRKKPSQHEDHKQTVESESDKPYTLQDLGFQKALPVDGPLSKADLELLERIRTQVSSSDLDEIQEALEDRARKDSVVERPGPVFTRTMTQEDRDRKELLFAREQLHKVQAQRRDEQAELEELRGRVQKADEELQAERAPEVKIAAATAGPNAVTVQQLPPAPETLKQADTLPDRSLEEARARQQELADAREALDTSNARLAMVEAKLKAGQHDCERLQAENEQLQDQVAIFSAANVANRASSASHASTSSPKDLVDERSHSRSREPKDRVCCGPR